MLWMCQNSVLYFSLAFKLHTLIANLSSNKLFQIDFAFNKNKIFGGLL